MPDLQPLPENEVLHALLGWGETLAAAGSPRDVEASVADCLLRLFALDDYLVLGPHTGRSAVVLLAHPQSLYHRVRADQFQIADVSFISRLHQIPVVESVAQCGIAEAYTQWWRDEGITDVLGVMLYAGGVTIGSLWCPLRKHAVVNHLCAPLFKGFCALLGQAVALKLERATVIQQRRELEHYRDQLDRMQAYIHGDVAAQPVTGDIIGHGPEMQKVFQRVAQVSFTNSTVLILGETGTGKELIAQAIHNGSPRRGKPLIRVNCAALPANLIESELFGHEKGSFTGAVERRIGKFELADTGTLFLDEVGEMPVTLQAKLLRAIQEREIERVGGQTTLTVDVRIIAATNRVLETEVAEGRFRKDLYYRLNVFPIVLPPLRKRTEDIPALVTHFISRFAPTGRSIPQPSRKTWQALLAYDWPGNIRELEHFIERSVLMTTGRTLKAARLRNASGPGEVSLVPGTKNKIKNFADNERDHILQALKACGGKVYGAGGAAHLLGLKVSTLNSKMLKLGIKKWKMYTGNSTGS